MTVVDELRKWKKPHSLQALLVSIKTKYLTASVKVICHFDGRKNIF